MQHKILIIGGTGLVGSTIHRILKERNPTYDILIGTRSPKDLTQEIKVDVNSPSSLEVLLAYSIDLIILSVNDPENHVLRFAIQQGIDYVDITKPTPALTKALKLTSEFTSFQSRIVFGSGWMGGIVPGLVKSSIEATENIENVQLRVYYSTKDKAGKSSAHFMAEYVATPFVRYENNQPVVIKHFLDSERYTFSFGLGNRQLYNFDTPDLYILNQIEAVPTVGVKMTYNSKYITRILGWMQQGGIFNKMTLSTRRALFGGSGDGDLSVFEIQIKTAKKITNVRLKSKKGQAELTAVSTVLHLEALFKKSIPPGQYFAHQLHQKQELLSGLQQCDSITIEKV